MTFIRILCDKTNITICKHHKTEIIQELWEIFINWFSPYHTQENHSLLKHILLRPWYWIKSSYSAWMKKYDYT